MKSSSKSKSKTIGNFFFLGLREDELKALKGRKYLDALCVYFWATTPVLVAISTFTTYVLTGGTLSPARVFTCMALFNMLIGPLNAFPWVMSGLVEAWISLKRVRRFIQVTTELNSTGVLLFFANQFETFSCPAWTSRCTTIIRRTMVLPFP